MASLLRNPGDFYPADKPPVVAKKPTLASLDFGLVVVDGEHKTQHSDPGLLMGSEKSHPQGIPNGYRKNGKRYKFTAVSRETVSVFYPCVGMC